MREFYPRYSETREAVVHRVDDEAAIVDELAALAERFDRAVETDVWNPSPGRHCTWCVRPSACPIPDFAKGEGAVRDPETAQRVAARLIVAEAAAKQAKKALKGYAEIHGPVPVKAAKGRAVWGFRESSSVLRPKREDLEQALAAGDVNLDELYTERKSARFEQHAPKDAEPENGDGDLVKALEESLKAAQQRKEQA